MGAMWLGPLLFVAVSIFLWKYVGAVFMPELLARSIFQFAPGLASVELYITINAALFYFGGYFAVAIFWRSLKPHFRNPFTAGLVLWLVNGLVILPILGRGILGYRLPQGWIAVSFPMLVFCPRSTVPGQAFMRLILAVFGIAVVLILAWAILWISAGREKD